MGLNTYFLIDLPNTPTKSNARLQPRDFNEDRNEENKFYAYTKGYCFKFFTEKKHHYKI